MAKKNPSAKQLLEENQDLRARLEELEETLHAIQNGEVDAFVVSGEQGEQVFTLKDAGQPYRVLMETMNEGAVTVAADGTVLYSNLRFATMLRMPLDRVIGSSIRLHVIKDELPAFDRLFEKCLHAACQREVRLLSGDKTLPVQLSFSPVLSDGMHCAVVVITDLTEQKRIEGALRRASEELEDRVQERTADLRASEARFQALYSSMNEGLAIHDIVYEDGKAIDYIITEVNPAFEKITGITRTAAIGKRASEIYETREAPYLDIYAKVTSTGEPTVFETYFPPMEKHFMISVFSPGRENFATVFQDITERKKAEAAVAAAHRQTQSIINNTTSLVYAFDLEERFVIANTAVAELFDSTPEQILGKRRDEFMPKEDADWHEANDRQVIEAGRALEFEESNQLKGRSITWLTTKFPLRDAQGKIYAVAGISADITARKQAEEELRNLTEKLMRSNSDLKQFAYIASHDLQSPLRNIEGFVRLLAKRYKNKLDDKADEYITHISGGVKDMQDLIHDLLQISTLDSGDKSITSVDMTLCVNKAISSLKAAIEEKNTEITCDERLPVVHGVFSQLTSLLQNLIGNAIKFCQEQPKVHISSKREGDLAIFTIRDNGIGIDTKDADRIFAVFQRLHAKTEYPGTGIGLAICRKIVERHGGRIWVESEPGRGSTFYFTLPMKE